MKTATIAVFFAFLTLTAPLLGSQDMQTAEQFFNQVSDRYAQVNDYEGQISINSGKQVMYGNIAFKAPSLLRIDFSQPAEQVIVYDGSRLLVYIPQYHAVLSQDSGDVRSTGAGLASRDGLKMMKRSYTIAWETSPEPVPLDPGSSEQIQRLSLVRKNVSDGLKAIKLSVNPETKLIRRIEGWTIANEKLVFNFSGIKTNVGISANRFMYDTPATANVYNNFLFKSDN